MAEFAEQGAIPVSMGYKRAFICFKIAAFTNYQKNAVSTRVLFKIRKEKKTDCREVVVFVGPDGGRHRLSRVTYFNTAEL